ncbi:MAG: hypothetical protein KDA67_06285 [Rhodobacteraceae bacterium]|nr:hypothetical protein [Paracoccaceae bacterium]
MQETDLYQPIKHYLEGQGYKVKAEVMDCDLVACRGDEPPLLVELKLNLSIALLLQGVDRLALSDLVYIAVPKGKGAGWRARLKGAVKLCRRLGLGLITVRLGAAPLVEVHADPLPYTPRKNRKRQVALLREFSRRVGDQNKGGQVGRPVVTAYRQDALRLAAALKLLESARPAELAKSECVPTAGAILQRDYYGWFLRINRGVYTLSEAGHAALGQFDDVVAAIEAAE